MKCNICKNEKEYKSNRALNFHKWLIHTEEGKAHQQKLINSLKNVSRGGWNKGLTKETDERVKQFGQTYSNRIKNGELKPYWLGHHHTLKTKKKLSLNAGGYRKGSGRGKHGWYKGFWCDSSWELAYVIYCLEHNIFIQRNTKRFKYMFEEKEHHYTPDYKINDSLFVEIKGYINKKWQEKVKQFPVKLEIIDKKKIKPILKYVNEKYGKDFIKLYNLDR
ncbi:MAG: hypothetical protein WC554_14815 [Clostridia bacterium]|jgi:hypothetical protein